MRVEFLISVLLLLSGAVTCSTVDTIPSPPTFILNHVCSLDSAGTDSLTLMNQANADSVIVTVNYVTNHGVTVDETDMEAHFPFNGNANDASGNGHNGVMNNVVSAHDRFGNDSSAFYFSGDNSYIDIGNSLPHFNGFQPFTVSVWVRSVSDGIVVSRYNGSVIGEWILNLNSGMFSFLREVPPYNINTDTIVEREEWMHFVARYNGTTQAIFINGKLETAAIRGSASNAGSTNVFIGARLQNNAIFSDYQGYIDDLRIFSRSLSNDEISDLFEQEGGDRIWAYEYGIVCDTADVGPDTTFHVDVQGCDSLTITLNAKETTISSDGLVGYFPFNGNAQDESGFENHGAINGPSLHVDRFGNQNAAYYYTFADQIVLDHNITAKNDFSLSAWYSIDNNYFDDHFLVLAGAGAQNNFSVNLKREIDGRVWITIGSTVYKLDLDQFDGEWHHIVVKRTGSLLEVYFDNTSVYSNVITELGPLQIGAFGSTANSQYLPGRIDDIRVYDRALSAAGIDSLFNEVDDPIVNYSYLPTCDTNLVDTDTLTVTNSYGCDSTIIEYTGLVNPALSDGLIAYFPFDGNPHNQSGWENMGTLFGPTLAVDRFDRADHCYFYDFADDIKLDNRVEVLGDFAISLWYVIDNSHGDDYNMVLSNVGSINPFEINARRQNNGSVLLNIGTQYHYFGVNHFDGNWHNMIVSRQNSELRVYFDGQVAFSNNTFNPAGISVARFGGTNDSQFFPGRIDDVLIWDRSLSTLEIQQLFGQVLLQEEVLFVEDSLVDFGTIASGDTAYFSTKVVNNTCDVISFDNIYSSNGAYSVDISNFTVYPYQFFDLNIAFHPDETVLYPGNIRLESATDSLNILLSGLGCVARPMLAYSALPSLCTDDTFKLSTDLGIPINWNIGGETDTLIITEEAEYFGIYSTGTGCILYTDTLLVEFVPDAEIEVVGFTTLCLGDSSQLEAQNADSYLWSTGDTVLQIFVKPDSSTWYYLLATNTLGCTYEDSVHIEIIPPEIPDSVSNMVPYDNTIDLSSSVAISWLPPANASSFDIYYWLTGESKPGSPGKSNVQGVGTTINNLMLDTAYYWQIHAKNSCFEQAGPVHSFRTRLLPDLIVDSIFVPVNPFSGQIIQISWITKNDDSGPTFNDWFDRLFLSQDPFYNPGIDISLGSSTNLTALLPGEGYLNTKTVTLPQGLDGVFYVFVVCDANLGELESNETNNRSFMSMPITLTPPPDLQVTDILPPNNAFSGDTINIRYSVKNEGNGGTLVPSWLDRIYISDDMNFSQSTAVLLSNNTHDGIINSGETYVDTVSVIVPKYIFGPYYFHVVTDVNNSVYEFAFEDNNVGTSPMTTIFLTPPPDLQISNITGPQVIYPGFSFTLSYNGENAGATPTDKHWNDAMYLSQADTLDGGVVFIKRERISEVIQPLTGYSRTTSAVCPELPSGLHYIHIEADEHDELFEFNQEDNNTYTLDSVLVILPDLTIFGLSAVDTAFSGDPLSINYSIENNSAGKINNEVIYDQIYLSTDSIIDSGDSLLSEYNYSLSMVEQQSLQKSTLTTLPNGISGTYYLIARTDAFMNILEESEINNQYIRRIEINLKPSADLVVDSIFPIADTIYALSQSYPFKYRVANIGNAAADATNWKDRLFLSIDPIWQHPDSALEMNTHEQLSILSINESYEVHVDFTLPMVRMLAPGFLEHTFYVYAITDIDNDVFENGVANGNNITRSDPFYVICPDEPDFDVTAVSTIPKDTFEAGESLALSWDIINRGSTTAYWNYDIWYDGVYLSADSIWDEEDQLIEDFTRAGPLDSLEQYTENRTITIPNGFEGNFCLMLVADNQEYINEQSESNNVDIFLGASSGPNIYIKQKDLPNLVVETFESPQSIKSGQPFEIIYEIKNEGIGELDLAWTDKLYLSSDFVVSSNDYVLMTRSKQPTLAPGSFYRDTVSVNMPLAFAGNFVLLLKADANNKVFEDVFENDNIAIAVVSVERDDPADLVVTNISFPDSAMVNEKIDLTYTILNQGSNPASGIQRDIIYLSTDTIFDVLDVPLGSQTVSSQLGQLTTETRTISMTCTPGLSIGEYYVFVQVDALDNINETSDSNNVMISSTPINITVPELPLDIWESNSLKSESSVFYKIEIPDSLAGEALQITLLADSMSGRNEMYLSFNKMPTRSEHEEAHLFPFQGNQLLILPELQEGTYYLNVYGVHPMRLAQAMQIKAEVVEFSIRSVSSTQGGNTGSTTVEIKGARFEDNMVAQLTDSSGNQYTAQRVYLVDGTTVYATFNLRGAQLGLYNINLNKLDQSQAVLNDAYTIIQGSLGNAEEEFASAFTCNIKNYGVENLISSNIIAPQSVRVGRVVPITIQFGNNGNVDIPCPTRFMISVRGAPLGFTPEELNEMKQELYLVFEEAGGPPGILRPGAIGQLTVYTKSSHPLKFYIQE